MNRQEFMARLEALLSGIPEEEKQEALAYYAGYFEDAGEENEEQIIKELESPEKVAATIRADLNESENEAGAENFGAENSANTHTYQSNTGYQNNTQYQNNAPDNTARNILIVILLILSAPVWGGIVIGIGGGLIGIVAGLCGTAIGCIVGGAIVFGVGIATLVGGMAAAGFISMGAGLLVLAIGLLALGLLILVCGRFLPWAIRGIVRLFQRILYPKGGQRA